MGRLKAYADKKAKKPGPIAKSNIILDVKPWDDETNMNEVESLVRTIKADGLLWVPPKWLQSVMVLRNFKLPVLLKMTKSQLISLKKKSQPLKSMFNLLILLLSTKCNYILSFTFEHYSSMLSCIKLISVTFSFWLTMHFKCLLCLFVEICSDHF